MSIEYTKVDAANRQAFYETSLTVWDQRWGRDFQQELLDWRYARRAPGETLCAVALPVHRAHRYFPSLLSRPAEQSGRWHAPHETADFEKGATSGSWSSESGDRDRATSELEAPAGYARLRAADHDLNAAKLASRAKRLE